MGTAAVLVDAGSIPDVVMQMRFFQIAVVGSRESDFGVVAFVISGERVPDAPWVTATITQSVIGVPSIEFESFQAKP